MFYALVSAQAEVAKRVNLFIAFAPIVHMDHVNVKFLSYFAEDTAHISEYFSDLGFFELMGQGWAAIQSKWCSYLINMWGCDKFS